MKQVNVNREEMRNFFMRKLADEGFACLDIVDLL